MAHKWLSIFGRVLKHSSRRDTGTGKTQQQLYYGWRQGCAKYSYVRWYGDDIRVTVSQSLILDWFMGLMPSRAFLDGVDQQFITDLVVYVYESRGNGYWWVRCPYVCVCVCVCVCVLACTCAPLSLSLSVRQNILPLLSEWLTPFCDSLSYLHHISLQENVQSVVSVINMYF